MLAHWMSELLSNPAARAGPGEFHKPLMLWGSLAVGETDRETEVFWGVRR